MDQNPYESPRSESPLTRGQIVKRGIGVGLILLLTPPAIAVAILSSCTAAFSFSLDLVPSIVVACFPLIVLTGLMVWAVAIERRNDYVNRSPRRIVYLLATPLVFLVSIGAAFALGGFIVEIFSRGSGGLSPRGMTIGVTLFFLLPSLSLVAMLVAAWRAE